MANNRLEELRRRAQERIQEVREAMDRGEDVAPDHPAPEPPRRAERQPEQATASPYEVRPGRRSIEGPSLEGPSLEGPSLEVSQPEPVPQREQPRAQRPAAPPPQRAAAPVAHHNGRQSGAAQILNRETLRQVILAQEILGKPVSLRQPREVEDL